MPERAPVTMPLREWMPAHGYSNATLAKALGVDRTTVIRWRTGRTGRPTWVGIALAWLEAREEDRQKRAEATAAAMLKPPA